jgi:hypothetical protein
VSVVQSAFDQKTWSRGNGIKATKFLIEKKNFYFFQVLRVSHDTTVKLQLWDVAGEY